MPPERDAGYIVGIIAGALTAIGAVGAGLAIYLRGRGPLPPPAGPTVPEPEELALEAEPEAPAPEAEPEEPSEQTDEGKSTQA